MPDQANFDRQQWMQKIEESRRQLSVQLNEFLGLMRQRDMTNFHGMGSGEIYSICLRMQEWARYYETWKPTAQYFADHGDWALLHRLVEIQTELARITQSWQAMYQDKVQYEAKAHQIAAGFQSTWFDAMQKSHQATQAMYDQMNDRWLKNFMGR